MADNAFVKIGTALLKHQVKKLVGEEALGAIGEELADIGGDKLDAWLGDQSTIAEIEKAAGTARDLFRGKVNDDEVEQWMVMLPIHDLPAVLSAVEELPKSPDEKKLENALRESIALNWKRLSTEQVNNAVNAFMSCLRSALLPIEKQTLMIIGRSVLRIEEKVDQLAKFVEQLKPFAPDGMVRMKEPDFKYDVFISYSHKDEDWKDRLVTHLHVLQMQGMINVWDDRRIEVGDDWRPEIEEAINRASIAVLMISANFLTSKFIVDNEVPKLLERRTKGGLRVIPLIVKSCAWKQVKWLSEIQGRPKDNQPLSSGSEHQIDSNLAALAEEIAAIVKG